jgi:U4/U6.U5 tri-snRNP-associated protein 2
MSFVPTIRDFFLREQNYKDIKMPSGDISFILGKHYFNVYLLKEWWWNTGLILQYFYCILAQRFGELLRKLWNPRNFKAHVSPHEMLQVQPLFFDYNKR